jgi:pyruvate/2-oxoglutarate dehydrogenase complex dihydrolipoamide dehydrogenase (E3) component
MNAREALRPDLCILGASAAGSALAIAAAAQGLSVALVGKEPAADRLASIVSGEAFRAVAKVAAAQRPMQLLGASGPRSVPDFAGFARAQAHIADVADALAPKYAQARVEAMKVTVLKPPGRFIRPDAVETAAGVIKARRFVIAPALQRRPLSIRGLDLIQPLSAADLRRLEGPPERLIIVGADPQGLEIAQAMRRLGGEVALLSETRIFADEDDEIVAPLRLQFLREGVVLREDAKILRVEPDGAGLRVLIAASGAASEGEAFAGSHLFLASGVAPALEGLGLAAAGVRFNASGVEVDANLRSSNRRIYAIGAAASGDAEGEAYRVLRHMRRSPFGFFAGRSAPPRTRVAWTSPQIAFTGLTEGAARERRRRICVSRFPYSCADRAEIEGAPAGHVKLVTTRAGKILGAAMVGPIAGELINLYTLSISEGMHASDLASAPVSYPCFAEAARGAALTFEARRTAANWRIFRIARLIAQAIR